MTEVIMPKMGDGMEEGTLLEWLKKDGETVKSGDIIGTIQTDKATLELEAPGTGVLTGFLIKEGDTVPVGKAIAAIVKDGETLPSGWAGGNGKPAPATEIAETPKAEAPQAEAPKEEAAKPEPAPTPASTDRIKASPLARKIAAEKGVDLATVQGSGPGGRIIEKDVVQAQPAAKTSAAPIAAPSAADTTVKLNKIRQITAQRTQHSKQTVPHFYVTVEVDLTHIQTLRDMFEADGRGKVSVNDFVIKACAAALREMPVVNSSFLDATTLLQNGAVNIGMAVALEDGLTLPVIQNADELSIRQIGAASRDLAAKARSNKLSPNELSGATFSISNMGMLNVESFSAVIVEPNAGILAIGTAKKTLVVNEDDEAEIRMVMKITGSFDHRVVDGSVGAKFVNVVREFLENPTRLLG